MLSRPLPAALLSVALSSLLPAQGRTDYLNVETPQVKPIAIARVGNVDFVLACNTPDNSVEVWRVDESIPQAARFVARVPVGLEPCSVVWNPTLKCFYTTDFLGDSVSMAFLLAGPDPYTPKIHVYQTRNLGSSSTVAAGPTDTTLVDAPMDVAVLPGGSLLAVTSATDTSVTFLDALTLQPVAPSAAFAGHETFTLQSGNTAVKEARRVLAFGDEVFVLNFKGGRDYAMPGLLGADPYDLDVFAVDTQTAAVRTLDDMGTTNAGMAMAANGDLYVVGGFARNDLLGGTQVAAAPTGFVESHLWVQRAGVGGAATGALLGRDLNLDPATGQAVARDDALAGPRDLVVHELTNGDRKLYIAAMHSDRVGVLVDDGGPIANWTRATIDLTPPSTPLGRMAGPRGLALKPANAADPNDPGDRLYVLNRLANAFAVIDVNTDTVVTTIGLDAQPVPAYVNDGRAFLYNARISLSGLESCASCHMDARTDSLAWDLGSATGYVDDVPTEYVDSPAAANQAILDELAQTGFTPQKGLMVTQTLQGLNNYQVEPGAESFVTNAPHHWRGDRSDFLSFNEAYVGLMGRADGNMNNGNGSFVPPPDRPLLPMGISNAEMTAYQEFIHGVHYEPNPHQQLDREFSGDFGPAGFENNIDEGSGALAGLKAFHVVPTLNGRSCAHCHQLPDGSNNVFTFFDGRSLESAQMRGLLQREKRLLENDGQFSAVISANFGMLAPGSDNGINSFVNRFLSFMNTESNNTPDGPNPGVFDISMLMNFVHELDWGVAPMVGQSETITGAATSLELQRVDSFEAEAERANVGLALHLHRWFNGSESYRYDPTTGVYAAETGATGTTTRAALVASLGVRDSAIFRATPLGSERRVATLGGPVTGLGSSAITGGELLGMLPNTSMRRVPELVDNWTPGTGADDFDFNHPLGLPTPPSMRIVRMLQRAQIADSGSDYGADALRHDAARRFRVAAKGLQPGARIEIGVWPSAQPTSGSPSSLATRTLSLPIYASGATTADGRPIWETAVEFDPTQYLLLLAGGPSAPGVAGVLDGSLPENPFPVGLFDPTNWNRQWVELINPDGTSLQLGWVALTLD